MKTLLTDLMRFVESVNDSDDQIGLLTLDQMTVPE